MSLREPPVRPGARWSAPPPAPRLGHRGVRLRRPLLAATGGVLLFAAHPPLDLGWIGAVALVPLLALVRDVNASPRPVRAALVWGLLAGMVFFLPLLTWVARFGTAAWLLLALVEATFVAGALALVAAWGDRPWRGAVAVVAWVGAEALRSQVPLGGFPWGVLGYSQHGGGVFLPSARVVGVLGVSALLVAVAVCVEEMLARRPWRTGWRWLRAPVGALAVLAALTAVLGVPAPPATGKRIDIAAVQGNDVELPPVVDRTDTDRVQDVAQRMLSTTRRLGEAAEGPPEVTVWPENALDADPRQLPELAAIVTEAQRLLDGGTLIAGTLLDGSRPATFRNAMVQYGPGGTIADVYVKRALVPFGEYVPWRSALGALPPLRAIPRDGVPGGGPGVFEVGGTWVGTVLCYESIFPDLVGDQVRAGAQALVVSTNNASFGRTPAARQHLAFSQLRAVETGRWVLQAGISGISAVVAPDGDVSQQTQLFEQAVVRAQLPLVTAATPYTRLGDVVGPAALAIAGAIALWLLVVGRTRARGGRL